MLRTDLRIVPIALATSLLAGCSTMPEWTKPSTWVDGVTEATKAPEGEAAKPADAQLARPVAAPAPQASDVIDPLEEVAAKPRIQAADKPTSFPNIAAQPDPRQLTTTDSQRREIRDGLVADRDNARHSAEELRGGTAQAATPPAPKPAEDPAAKPDGSE